MTVADAHERAGDSLESQQMGAHLTCSTGPTPKPKMPGPTLKGVTVHESNLRRRRAVRKCWTSSRANAALSGRRIQNLRGPTVRTGWNVYSWVNHLGQT